ncbi:MAG: DNA repair protein RecN [Pseudomonadota bacterium]
MLQQIHIRDFAIVDQLELEFGPGLTVLTGETGAGKSILLDALGLALGDRADSDAVAHGAERAEISAEFDLGDIADARDWLREQELDDADDPSLARIRRTISADGRSRAWINGRPAAVAALRELGEKLVDIHGQHAHQSLLRKEAQRQRLDDFAGHPDLLERVATRWREQRDLRSELEQLQQAGEDREARRELLAYQVQELEALGLGADEPAELEAEHQRLGHARRLIEACERAMATLYEGDDTTVSTLLGQTTGELEELQTVDSELGPAVELLNSAAVQVREAATELRHYRDGLELDPGRLEEVNQRLDTMYELARKHRRDPGELPELLPQLQEELAGLDHAGERLDGLQAELDAARAAYDTAAAELASSRREAADRLATEVNAHLEELGLGGATFEVELTPLDNAGAHGVEGVQFLVTTNPGQPLKPLQRVASGGELARISLAIQVITARSARIPTLVFDEVDVGIGGGVAEKVGRRLRELGIEQQVFCVTHQPQVAAQGHNHFQVSKENDDGITRTGFKALEDGQRVVEVARMLGGVEITSQTLAHAQEMIERAREVAAARDA